MPKHTVQNRLCLLPDQLGIFIRYGELLGLTLIILVTRAILWRPSSTQSKIDLEGRIPLSTSYTNGDMKQPGSPPLQSYHKENDSTSSTFSTNAVTSRRGQQLQAPSSGYGNIPHSSRSRTPSPSKRFYQADSDDWGNPTTTSDRIAYAHRHHDPQKTTSSQEALAFIGRLWLIRRPRTKTGEFVRSVLYISGPVLGFYFWLLWTDL